MFFSIHGSDPEDYPGNQQSKMSGAFDIENCLPVGDYADDAESFSEYGEETTRFNEDGSFIGAYKESQKAVQQRRTSESFVWNVYLSRQPSRKRADVSSSKISPVARETKSDFLFI